MTAVSVELKGVSKAFGATPVVRGVSARVEAGGMLALLGPSGCGKTTTLRMIGGLESPDSGLIVLGAQTVAGPGVAVPPERRGLGMVFQSYAVWPHKTVAENVAYPLERLTFSRAERATRVRQALDWVRLSGFATRRPQELSGGQLQRVALARALVGDPKVLLLDEPLSNLDVALREELRGEIAALRARLGTTVVLVTHDQGEALALADTVAVMNGGSIEQLGAPRQVHDEPATPFVAQFVARANLLTGTRRGDQFNTDNGTVFALNPDTQGPDGPGTLTFQPEAVEFGANSGTPLVLSAALFMGAFTEYRFAVGTVTIRAVGPHAPNGERAGATIRVTLRRARVYPSK